MHFHGVPRAALTRGSYRTAADNPVSWNVMVCCWVHSSRVLIDCSAFMFMVKKFSWIGGCWRYGHYDPAKCWELLTQRQCHIPENLYLLPDVLLLIFKPRTIHSSSPCISSFYNFITPVLRPQKCFPNPFRFINTVGLSKSCHLPLAHAQSQSMFFPLLSVLSLSNMAYSTILRMEAAGAPETLVPIYRTRWHYIPEDSKVYVSSACVSHLLCLNVFDDNRYQTSQLTLNMSIILLYWNRTFQNLFLMFMFQMTRLISKTGSIPILI